MAKRNLFTEQHSHQTPPKVMKDEPLSPGDISFPNQHANVHALVASLFPVKTESSFFDGELTDGKFLIRIVGFEQSQREQLESYSARGVPITLRNCQIQHNKIKKKLEIVIRSHTKIEDSNTQFEVIDLKIVGSTWTQLDKFQAKSASRQVF